MNKPYMSVWAPIETAPRDGKRVLLYRADFSEDMAVCWWNNSEWIPVHGSEFPCATHWMELPERP